MVLTTPRNPRKAFTGITKWCEMFLDQTSFVILTIRVTRIDPFMTNVVTYRNQSINTFLANVFTSYPLKKHKKTQWFSGVLGRIK